MDEYTRELIDSWAIDNFLKIPNELLEVIKEISKKKKTTIRLFLVALILEKLPEEFKKLIRPLNMSIVSEKSYKRNWKEIREVVSKFRYVQDNYTKVKIETILKLLNDEVVENSDILLYLEIAKWNALFRSGNKREFHDNYSMWSVYTKEIKSKLLDSLSEMQIRTSIYSLEEQNYIKVDKVFFNKKSKRLKYPYWKLSTLDIKELAISRKAQPKVVGQDQESLEQKLQKLFEKHNEKRSVSEITDLVTYFNETKDRNGTPWGDPLRVVAKDIRQKERYMMQDFYKWREDRRIATIEKEKRKIKEWVNKGCFEAVESIAKGFNDVQREQTSPIQL